MEKMIDLRDLLKHEIVDLYSVESQIIDALPDMIDKANNPSLKKALTEHLAVTEKQKERLDQIKSILVDQSTDENKDSPGFFARIFGGGEEKCKGMEGILEEGKKMMGADMTPEVLDAAIIASSQKVEHYEICGYGTALAYARELLLQEVADLLGKSLDEEYEADDNLTFLAVGHLNLEAEFAGGDLGDDQPLKQQSNNNNNKNSGTKNTNSSNPSNSSGRSSSGNKRTSSQRASAPQKSAASKKSAPKKFAPKKSAPSKSATSSGRGGSTKSAPGKGMNGKKGNAAAKKSAAPSKSAAGKSGRSSVSNKAAGRASGKAMNAGNRGGKTSSRTASAAKGNTRSSAPKKGSSSGRSMMSKAPAKKGNAKSNSKGKRR